MSKNIAELIAQVIVKDTNSSLADQKRIIEFQEKEGNYKITYSSNGLSIEQKRDLEDKIYKIFEDQNIPEDNLILMAKSDSQKSNPSSGAPQASLKTGHGPAGANKKRVPGVKKVIAIASGKGGVGKSTVSTNLALSLVKKGLKVGLIDADIYGPSIPMMIGKRQAKPEATDDRKIKPLEIEGLKVISFGNFVPEGDPVIWRGPMLGGVLNQFLFDVNWGELDVLLLDLPPGTGDVQLSMVQLTELDGAIIVTTPQNVALLDAVKGLKMFEQVKVPVVGIIENMSSFVCDQCGKEHNIFGHEGGKEKSKELEVNFLGHIPLEKDLRESADKGEPYMLNSNYDGRQVWKSYMAIADKVVTIVTGAKKGFFQKLFS